MISNTDLTVPDVLYVCPVCKDDSKSKNWASWKMGNLVNHIKNKHAEHFTTKVKPGYE